MAKRKRQKLTRNLTQSEAVGVLHKYYELFLKKYYNQPDKHPDFINVIFNPVRFGIHHTNEYGELTFPEQKLSKWFWREFVQAILKKD